MMPGVLLLAVALAVDTGAMEAAVREAIEDARLRVEEQGGVRAWGRLGDVLHAHGLWREAADAYGRAAEHAGDDFRWPYLQAVVLEADGADAGRIEALYERAVALKGTHVPLLVRGARAKLRSGKVEEALALSATATRYAPSDGSALRTRGEVLLQAGRAADAIAVLEQAARAAPDVAVRTALARAYAAAGDRSRAEDAARSARRAAPAAEVADPLIERRIGSLGRSSRHRLERAQARLATGEYEAALVELEPVLEIRAGDADLHYLIGMAHAGRLHWGPAKEAWDRALALDPDHARARLELARLAVRAGDEAEARAQLEAARRRAPRDVDVLFELLQLEERPDVRLAICRDLVALRPDDAEMHAAMAEILARTGDVPGAVASYETALALDPDRGAWRRRLALLRAENP